MAPTTASFCTALGGCFRVHKRHPFNERAAESNLMQAAFSGFEKRAVDSACVSSAVAAGEGAHPGGVPGLCALGDPEAPPAREESGDDTGQGSGFAFHPAERRHCFAHHRGTRNPPATDYHPHCGATESAGAVEPQST